MTERLFVLVDFTVGRAGCLQLYQACRAYALPRAVAPVALGIAEHVPTARGVDRGRGGRGKG